MKIRKAILDESSATKVTFETDPPLSDEVFREFQKIQKGPEFPRCVHVGMRLVILKPFPVPGTVLIQHLNDFLTRAEEAVARKQGKTESAREMLRKGLADEFGLPVE